MRRLVVWIAIVGVGGLLLPATAGAQGGSISGQVEDTTGGILPGVTVEADSPVNIEGTITAFTDGAGRYTIINLRPGTYTITFTLPGFNTFVREGILLVGDAAVQIDAQMAVGALEETVTVSGESPVVDVQQVRRQFVATRQMMDVLPAARTFAARALLIPGVRNTGMSEGTYWPAVHGSTWKDAQTMNDGMRANSTVDDGQWQMGWEMNDAATAELTYEAGGAPAEAQVGGVVQNAIPKEGGNTFSGTWFTYYGAEAFASSNADAELRELLGEVNRLAYDYDTNPAFGGRFIRDRLWFFTAMRAQDRKEYQAGSFFAEPGEACSPAGIQCQGRQEALDYFGVEAGDQTYYRSYGRTGLLRLTNQLSDRHKWRIGFERVNRQHPLANANQDRPPEASNRIRQPTGYHAQTRWTSSLSNRLLFEAGFSVQYNKWRREQFEWNQTRPSTYDLSTGTWGGGFWITGWQPEKSRYLKASMSYVTGSHNFKAGIEHRWGTISLDQPMFADTRTYYYAGDTPVGIQVLATPLGPGLGQPGHYGGGIDFDTGIFAQDSWTLGNWTLNLGARGDLFSSGVPPQSAPAGTWVPAREFPAYPGPRWNTLSARIGVAYDVFGDGRTALKGTMHQYVSSESTRLAMARNPLSSFTWSAAQEFRSWDDMDGNGSVVGPDGRVQYEEVGPSPNVNFGTANDLKLLDLDGREGHWEYNAQIQHELFSGVSATFGWYPPQLPQDVVGGQHAAGSRRLDGLQHHGADGSAARQLERAQLPALEPERGQLRTVAADRSDLADQRPDLRRVRVDDRRPAGQRRVLRRQHHLRADADQRVRPAVRHGRRVRDRRPERPAVVRLAAGVAVDVQGARRVSAAGRHHPERVRAGVSGSGAPRKLQRHGDAGRDPADGRAAAQHRPAAARGDVPPVPAEGGRAGDAALQHRQHAGCAGARRVQPLQHQHGHQ